MLVEDAANTALTVKMCLEAAGYRVRVSPNGAAALTAVYEEKPDLVLLDLVLPRISGYLVCQALREDSTTRDIPIIITSARSTEEDIRRAQAAGADEYLLKPFTPQELLEVVKKHLHGRSESNANQDPHH